MNKKPLKPKWLIPVIVVVGVVVLGLIVWGIYQIFVPIPESPGLEKEKDLGAPGKIAVFAEERFGNEGYFLHLINLSNKVTRVIEIRTPVDEPKYKVSGDKVYFINKEGEYPDSIYSIKSISINGNEEILDFTGPAIIRDFLLSPKRDEIVWSQEGGAWISDLDGKNKRLLTSKEIIYAGADIFLSRWSNKENVIYFAVSSNGIGPCCYCWWDEEFGQFPSIFYKLNIDTGEIVSFPYSLSFLQIYDMSINEKFLVTHDKGYLSIYDFENNKEITRIPFNEKAADNINAHFSPDNYYVVFNESIIASPPDINLCEQIRCNNLLIYDLTNKKQKALTEFQFVDNQCEDEYIPLKWISNDEFLVKEEAKIGEWPDDKDKIVIYKMHINGSLEKIYEFTDKWFGFDFVGFIEMEADLTSKKGFCGWSSYGKCSSDKDCMTGGCSGQVCQSKNEEPVITTCEWKDCYDEKVYGVNCKCVNNKCQWAE